MSVIDSALFDFDNIHAFASDDELSTDERVEKVARLAAESEHHIEAYKHAALDGVLYSRDANPMGGAKG